MSGVVRATDRLSTMNSTAYHIIINATDACGLSARHSTQLVIDEVRPVSASTPTFTATFYSFTVSHLAIPGTLIGYLHLATGMLVLLKLLFINGRR